MKLMGPDFARTIINSQGGIARLNRYRVVMPTLFIGGDAISLDVLCRSVTIPGRTLTTQQRRVNMRIVEVPNGYTNTPVDMIFTETNAFNVSRYIDTWMGRVVNPNTYEIDYRDNITRDILVMSTDTNGIPQYITVLQNAYPKVKTQIDMSDETDNTAASVRVQFEYEDFYVYENPLLSAVQDGINMLRSGRLNLPTNLIRGLSGGAEGIHKRIETSIGGLL